MAKSYDVDHEKEQMESALRAIIARIEGVFDDPDLMSFGSLGFMMSDDILAIARKALPKPDITTELADIMLPPGVKLGKKRG